MPRLPWSKWQNIYRNVRRDWKANTFPSAQAQLFEYENNEALRLRGLFLMSQDKNQQASEYFQANLDRAGLFTGFRNGLGDAYYYQQRPRQALEQYKISQGVDAKDKDSRIGMAYALEHPQLQSRGSGAWPKTYIASFPRIITFRIYMKPCR